MQDHAGGDLVAAPDGCTAYGHGSNGTACGIHGCRFYAEVFIKRFVRVDGMLRVKRAGRPLSDQFHRAIGHFKGKGCAGAFVCLCPAALRLFGCSAGGVPLLKLHPVAVFQGGSHCHRFAFLDPKAAEWFAVDGHTAQPVVDGYLVQLVPLCFQRHIAVRHFKGELLAGLPAVIRLYGCFAGGVPPQEGVFLRAFGPDGDQLARLHDLLGCAGVAVLVHDGAVCDVDIVQGRKECLQLYITFGHGEAETLLALPVLIRFHEFFLADKPPHIKLAVVVELAVRNFCDDPCARQRLVDFLLFCPFGKELSLSCGLKDQIHFSIFCAQAHVALRHLKARCCPAFCKRDHRRASDFRFCRQCRCAHAQHHAQRHEGRKQPLGQGRLLHMEFLLFAYGGGYASTLRIP